MSNINEGTKNEGTQDKPTEGKEDTNHLLSYGAHPGMSYGTPPFGNLYYPPPNWPGWQFTMAHPYTNFCLLVHLFTPNHSAQIILWINVL